MTKELQRSRLKAQSPLTDRKSKRLSNKIIHSLNKSDENPNKIKINIQFIIIEIRDLIGDRFSMLKSIKRFCDTFDKKNCFPFFKFYDLLYNVMYDLENILKEIEEIQLGYKLIFSHKIIAIEEVKKGCVYFYPINNNSLEYTGINQDGLLKRIRVKQEEIPQYFEEIIQNFQSSLKNNLDINIIMNVNITKELAAIIENNGFFHSTKGNWTSECDAVLEKNLDILEKIQHGNLTSFQSFASVNSTTSIIDFSDGDKENLLQHLKKDIEIREKIRLSISNTSVDSVIFDIIHNIPLKLPLLFKEISKLLRESPFENKRERIHGFYETSNKVTSSLNRSRPINNYDALKPKNFMQFLFKFEDQKKFLYARKYLLFYFNNNIASFKKYRIEVKKDNHITFLKNEKSSLFCNKNICHLRFDNENFSLKLAPSVKWKKTYLGYEERKYILLVMHEIREFIINKFDECSLQISEINGRKCNPLIEHAIFNLTYNEDLPYQSFQSIIYQVNSYEKKVENTEDDTEYCSYEIQVANIDMLIVRLKESTTVSSLLQERNIKLYENARHMISYMIALERYEKSIKELKSNEQHSDLKFIERLISNCQMTLKMVIDRKIYNCLRFSQEAAENYLNNINNEIKNKMADQQSNEIERELKVFDLNGTNRRESLNKIKGLIEEYSRNAYDEEKKIRLMEYKRYLELLERYLLDYQSFLDLMDSSDYNTKEIIIEKKDICIKALNEIKRENFLPYDLDSIMRSIESLYEKFSAEHPHKIKGRILSEIKNLSPTLHDISLKLTIVQKEIENITNTVSPENHDIFDSKWNFHVGYFKKFQEYINEIKILQSLSEKSINLVSFKDKIKHCDALFKSLRDEYWDFFHGYLASQTSIIEGMKLKAERMESDTLYFPDLSKTLSISETDTNGLIELLKAWIVKWKEGDSSKKNYVSQIGQKVLNEIQNLKAICGSEKLKIDLVKTIRVLHKPNLYIDEYIAYAKNIKKDETPWKRKLGLALYVLATALTAAIISLAVITVLAKLSIVSFGAVPVFGIITALSFKSSLIGAASGFSLSGATATTGFFYRGTRWLGHREIELSEALLKRQPLQLPASSRPT